VKSLVFLPLGVAVSRSGIAAGCALAVSVSIGIEFGQLFVIDRFPGTTDLVLAGISGMAGAMLGRGLMTPATDEIVDCEVAA
jgi:glycopeptide antibiotics resistance protein